MSLDRRGWPYEPVDGRPAPPPDAPPVEVAAEPPPPATGAGPRRATVLVSVAIVVAILLAGAGSNDWLARNREMRTLLDRIERAERAQLPVKESIEPRLLLCAQGAALDEPLQCDTVGIRQDAERVLPRLVQTGDEVAGTRLTSFHGSLRTFRDRYVAHNLAWRTWLEMLSRDPTADGFDSPEAINTTFEAASKAAEDALTPLPLHGNRARVDVIFASVR